MRTEAYVTKLLDTANNPKAKPDKIARMIEGAFRRLGQSEAGAAAIEQFEQRIAKRAVKRFARGIQ